MSLNIISEKKSIIEQREELLKLNNDLLYGVYSLKNESKNSYNLEFIDDILTCYPNQLENLKGLNENLEVIILDLNELRKGKFKKIYGENGLRYDDRGNFKTKLDDGHTFKVNRNLVLLSNGVIEFVEAKNYKGEIKKHLISTLRDGGVADSLQRTTTAGRNSGDNLSEDLEREHIEESPFLGYDKDGNLSLATIDNSEESKKILKTSINHFLENKYLEEGDDNYEFVKKNFERNFPGIKYNELRDILNNIVENDRFFTYKSKLVENFDGLEEDMKDISLGNSKGKYFTYFDKENNTIEYRLLRTITGFNDGFKPFSKRPSRLYLESENQYPRIPRIENASNGYVPTINYFSEKINKII